MALATSRTRYAVGTREILRYNPAHGFQDPLASLRAAPGTDGGALPALRRPRVHPVDPPPRSQHAHAAPHVGMRQVPDDGGAAGTGLLKLSSRSGNRWAEAGGGSSGGWTEAPTAAA